MGDTYLLLRCLHIKVDRLNVSENQNSMEVVFTAAGIHLPEIDLWLDPAQGVRSAWISHGHADHARGWHAHVYATGTTLRFYRLRWPEGENRAPQTLQPLIHGEAVDHSGARLTAYPAAHIPGAAQLLVEYKGERLVYSGDWKLRAPICGDATQLIPCDRLITECTFGLPIYHSLERKEATRQIVDFAQQCLEDEATPVFVGYALGRGQEIAHVLCSAGVPTSMHNSMMKFVPEYEACGYAFPGLLPYSAKEIAGRALVLTPSLRPILEAREANLRLAYVSGWAGLDNARARAGAERLIPWSDHADFQELLALVAASGARRIDCIHGYTETFAAILRGRGLDAHAPTPLASRASETEAGNEA
jgi:Cft2 family RNA processing exonuclease